MSSIYLCTGSFRTDSFSPLFISVSANEIPIPNGDNRTQALNLIYATYDS